MRAAVRARGAIVGCLLAVASAQQAAQPVFVNSAVLKSKVRIAPLYPRGAKAKGLSGKVHIHVWIGTDGRVEKTELREGNRELGEAAMDAMRYWTYEPYLVNGQAVKVKTSIVVHFR